MGAEIITVYKLKCLLYCFFIKSQYVFYDLAGQTGTDERYLQLARDANKMQTVIPDHIPFPCNVTGDMDQR